MRTNPILLMACLCGSLLHAQPVPAAPSDPFKDNGGDHPVPARPTDLMVCYEVFSVDPAKAAVMRREKPADGKFYDTLVALLPSGEVVQEDFAIVRCRSGQKVESSSVREIIYPTEYNPPLMVDPPPPAPIPPPILPTLPTAFETRNIGLLLEAEVTADEAQKDVDLRLVPQHVALAERWNWGKSASEVQQPIFESRHLNTMTTVRVGVPCLLGTMSPPPASKVDPNRIWFAFVTVTTFKK